MGKRIKIYMGTGALIVLAALLVFLVGREGQKVSAHPVKELKIDRGTKEEFVVFKDATEFPENIGGLNGYKQSLNYKGSIEKVNFESFSTHAEMGIIDSLVLPDKNILLLFIERNDVGTWNGLPWAATAYLLKVDPSGRRIKRINVPTGKDIYVTSADNQKTGEFALDVTGIFLDGQNYVVQYNGQTPTDKTNKNRLLKVDGDLNIISYSNINISSSNQGIYRNQFWPSLNTSGLNYNLGHRLTSTVAEANLPFPLDMQILDGTTGAVVKQLDLSVPAYSSLNADFDKFRPGQEQNGVTLSRVFDTVDQGYFVTGYANSVGVDTKQRTSVFVVKYDRYGSVEYYSSEAGQNQPGTGGTIVVQIEISTKDQIYFTRSVPDKEAELVEYNVLSKTEQVVKKFPIRSNFKIVPNEDAALKTSYDFYGSNYNNTGDLEGYLGAGVILGSMDGDFKIKSANYIHHTEGWINLTKLYPGVNQGEYFALGSTNSKSFSNIPQDGKWSEKLPFMNDYNLFYGSMKRNRDYPPAIYQPNSIKLNIEDPDLQKVEKDERGWTVKDRWLITGSKTGVIADSDSVKVYDTYDLANPVLGSSVAIRQEYLNKQINRNPLKKSNDIDWSALGLDLKNSGPQLVSYFVSDAQLQVSTTSRWVNKETDQTIEKDNIYLDAQNFSTPLKSVGTDFVDNQAFKKRAQTMAWDGSEGEIFEDTSADKFSDKVTIDQGQLDKLRAAKVAGPYPVDVTLTVSGKKIKNRVWVFVTTKNTVVDPKVGTVIYGDDYRLPLGLAKQESSLDVYRHGKIKVYNYRDKFSESNVLPTIADSEKTQGLRIEDLSVITGVVSPGVVSPVISFEWGAGKSSVKPEVTIYGELLVHVKQVILNGIPDLVIPTKSYFEFDYPDQGAVDLIGKSGELESNPAYTTRIVDFGFGGTKKKIDAKIRVPQYYRYKGYTVSSSDVAHNPDELDPRQYQHDLLEGAYEIWLTYYLEPSTDAPQLYSIDDVQNDLGNVRVE